MERIDKIPKDSQIFFFLSTWFESFNVSIKQMYNEAAVVFLTQFFFLTSLLTHVNDCLYFYDKQ